MRGLVLALAVLSVTSALGLGVSAPIAAEREASERKGLDRSLDDPEVKRVLEKWRAANRESRSKAHPSFDQLEGPRRAANEQRAERAERAERRRDPEQREKRRRSRRAFKDLDKRESTQLARQQFPQLFSPPETEALPLESGQRVVRYPEDDVALVESASGVRSVVDSTVPLVAPEGGREEPVDYGLEPTTDGWEPANAPSEVEFGERPGEAFSFGDELEAGIPGATGTATRTANEVFHKDVATDTDAWFGPGPAAGVRFAFQLRSADAPERLRLEFDAGPGVEFTLAPGAKALTVRRGGEMVGRMTAPLAFDADGQEIDVELSVEGDEVVFEIPHRGLDLAYPAVVDPVYEYANDWKYGNTNYAGWGYYEQVMQFPHGYNAGLYIQRNPNYYWYYGMFAEWSYRAPTAQSFIYRTDFQHVAHAAEATNTTQGMWSTRWNGHQHQHTRGYSFDDAGYAISVCADGGLQAWQCDEAVNLDQSNGNYVQSSLWANANGYRSYYPYMYFGGAYVWMNDVNNPNLLYWHDVGGAWMHDTPAGPYNAKNQSHVRWGDVGLGMWQLWMDVPGMARQYSTDAGGCSGAQSSRCPASRAHNFSYTGISQGTRTVTTTGQDVLGRVASASKTLRIDRSRPGTPAGSGSLYAQRDGFVAPQSYTLGIQGSDSYSGVKGVSYRVVRQATGAQVASGSASNPGCSTTGCSTTWKPPSDFAIDASGWEAGKHTVEMIVKDQLGDDPTHGTASHRSTSSFTVEMDRDPPTVSADHEGLEPWLDDDREITSTVTGSDSGSGVKSFTLDFPTDPDDTRTRTCSGTSTNRCPTQASETFAYRTNADRFPNEGRHQLRATVADARGSSTTSEPWEVAVDRTAPELALSGALYDRRGETLPAGTYELTADATDGNTDAPADERSGVRDLDVYVDGELVESRSQPCEAGSCSLSVDWTFDTTEQTGGEHTVEVRATDHLDQESVEEFVVSTPCCLSAASSWGTIFGPLDGVVFGDVDGDGFADAVSRKALTGALTVSRSTGSSFAAEQSWGTWSGPAAGAELRIGDVNGDVREDLVARDPADGKVYVALSTGSSFEAPVEWGTWPGGADFFVGDANGDGSADVVGRNAGTGELEVAGSLFFDDGGEERFEAPVVWSAPQPGLEIAPGDPDFDDTADLVGRAADGSLRVGPSSTIDFEAPTSWGSLSTEQELLVGDVNADGTADAIGREPASGEVRFAISDGEAFAAPDPVGTFDPDYPVELADVDGDADSDLVGRHELTGDIQVSLSNTAPAPSEPAPNWTPDPDIDYDDTDLFPETVGGFGIQQAPQARPKQMQLAMEDPTHSLLRRDLGLDDPFGADEQAANDKIDVIYDRMNRTGVSIVRFLVYWGYFENADGSFDPEALDRLSKAVDRAKANDMRVYLTLTGAAGEFECQMEFNPRSRVCTDPPDPDPPAPPIEPCGAPDQPPPGLSPEFTADRTPTGFNPDPQCFARFVRAVVERVGDRVKTYSIWNEPNQPRFLQTDDRRALNVVPADLYRDLYVAGRDAVLDVRPGAKVMIGELASSRRPAARFSAQEEPLENGITAFQFLYRVASSPLVTDGVAWHPYQHRAFPTRPGKRFVTGIGRIDQTQKVLDNLFDKGTLCVAKRLRTPACERPGLLYTEFGYRNRSPDPDDAHREENRVHLYDAALRRARFNDAKWMSIYEAVEKPGTDAREDYGLFSLEGDVRGRRDYGKGPAPGYGNRPLRQAYCDAIYKFAEARPRQYNTATREASGCG